MKKALTPKQRKRVYIKMLRYYSTRYYVWIDGTFPLCPGLCNALGVSVGYDKDDMTLYPELMAYKPDIYSLYWFPRDEKGLFTRICILQDAIDKIS